MITKPIWWEYALFDEDGLCGIKEDAPTSMKQAYEAYLKEQEEAEKYGIKI